MFFLKVMEYPLQRGKYSPSPFPQAGSEVNQSNPKPAVTDP